MVMRWYVSFIKEEQFKKMSLKNTTILTNFCTVDLKWHMMWLIMLIVNLYESDIILIIIICHMWKMTMKTIAS